MNWLDTDGARDYLAGGREPRPSRKVVYNMVKAGMRVAPRGDTGRRFWFCAEWIDEFLIERSAAMTNSSTPVVVQAKRRA